MGLARRGGKLYNKKKGKKDRLMVHNFDIEQFRIILHELFMELAEWIRSLK